MTKLTKAQRNELQAIEDGGPKAGRKDPSRYVVRMALWSKGFIDGGDNITERGRAALKDSAQ